MIALPQHTRVYLALGNTDMRKEINGLSILVEGTLSLDPFSGHLFGKRLGKYTFRDEGFHGRMSP